MGTHSVRSTRQPPKDREHGKPKKQLGEACKEMRDRIVDDRRKRESEEDRLKRVSEEDALMEQMYGPRWRETG